jgi:hypothetical protein
MYRTLSESLKSWKSSPFRKPLLLRGPRQVGKTWLLRDFGTRAYSDVAYFNFEQNPALATLFETTRDVTRILEQLATLHGTPIAPGTTLLVLDEIQESNGALRALKYFCEDRPDLHVAAAGSLLGVTLSTPSSFPVGKVDFLDLRPMTFSEFLLATGEQALQTYLAGIQDLSAVPDAFFGRLLELLARYMVIGGMPEPVLRWSVDQDMSAVLHTQKAILDSYELDFSKHAPASDIPKVGYLWRSLPAQLARDNRKFMYAAARAGARARGYEDALQWLEATGVVTRVFRCTAPRLPLSAYDDLSSFKLFALDTGLLARQSGLDPTTLSDPSASFVEFKGALAENYVLQALAAQFEVLPRYWTSRATAEVEFLVQRQNDIHPIEVKSGVNVRSKSLAVYRAEYSPRVAVRLSLKNLQFRDGLLDVPLFMVDQLDLLIGLAADSL